MRTLKQRIYAILNPHDHRSRLSAAVNIFIISLILINVVAASLETMESLSAAYGRFFFLLEVFSVLFFTLEYILRLWSITESRSYRSRLDSFFSFESIVDLMSILPFYIGFIFDIDLRALIAFRLIRLLKLVRYFEPLAIFGAVIKAEYRTFMSAMTILLILIFVASTGIYFFERETQPDAFGSIPQSMWWAIVTLTTLGYGDVVPATTAGRIFAALIAVFSIGTVALPAGMLASRFYEELKTRQRDFIKLVETLQTDGQLSEEDKYHLEEERSRLCLSKNDAINLIQSHLNNKTDPCPHCGK
jgi:voltage-gated potassium channel